MSPLLTKELFNSNGNDSSQNTALIGNPVIIFDRKIQDDIGSMDLMVHHIACHFILDN